MGPGSGFDSVEKAAVLGRLNYLVTNNAGAPCGRFNPQIVERRHDLEVENVIQFDDYTRLVVGANLRLDQGESETYVNGEVDNLSQRLFGNLEIHLLDPLYLNLGGYWERDQLNGKFSARVAH